MEEYACTFILFCKNHAFLYCQQNAVYEVEPGLIYAQALISVERYLIVKEVMHAFLHAIMHAFLYCQQNAVYGVEPGLMDAHAPIVFERY